MDSASLNTKASQETFMSLLQLDPTPMEAARAENEKELPPLPENNEPENSTARSPGTTSSPGLSGTGHGAVYYLTRIQRYSTYTFTTFTALHLATTSLIPLAVGSVRGSESYLLLARELYQTTWSEQLLVTLPAVAHVASGIALRLIRRNQNLKRYGGATPGVAALRRSKTTSSSTSTSSGSTSSHSSTGWPPVSAISASGYGFAALLAAHVFVNRGLPLLVEGDSSNIGLAFVAHGLARHAVVAWAAYTGLLAVGCGHMVWGWAKWLGLAQRAGWVNDWRGFTGNRALDRARRKTRRRFWLGINGAAVFLAAAWAAGGLGVVGRGGIQQGWVGKVYDDLYSKLPLH